MNSLTFPSPLISFAVTTAKIQNIFSNEFKGAGHTRLMREDGVLSYSTPVYGGVAEEVFKMALGNRVGFSYVDDLSLSDLFGYRYGSFVLEFGEEMPVGTRIGITTNDASVSLGPERITLAEMQRVYEDKT